MSLQHCSSVSPADEDVWFMLSGGLGVLDGA